MDFKFGEKNSLFAGRFCQYYPDVADKTTEEEILDATVFLTESRKNVLTEMFKTMHSDFQVLGKKSKIVLDGPEGRGKTYTLMLLSHLLRQSSKVFLVYFQNSKEINDCGWDEVCKQFKFSSPQEQQQFYEDLSDENSLIIENKLNNILKNNKKNGFLNVLMIDQLNFLTEGGQLIISKLFTMSGWDVELCSQSANNEPKKTFIKDLKPIYCPELMNEKEIWALLKDNMGRNNLNLQIDKADFKNIIQYTGFIPREAIRFIKTEGNSIENKLKTYIEKRSKELLTLHEKFRDALGDIAKNKLNIAIFYSDTDIPVFFDSEPCIDRQIQTLKEENNFYKFYSAFPLSRSILKKSIIGTALVDKNFFEERLEELRENLKKIDLDDDVRGIYYEEFIHGTIQNLQKTNQNCPLNIYSKENFRIKKYLVMIIFLYLYLELIPIEKDEIAN